VFKIVLAEKLSGKFVVNTSNMSSIEGYCVRREFNFFQLFSKLKLKYLLSTVCVSTILLFTISANVSVWPNVKGLSLEDKQNSIAFRNFRGSSCINEFNALKPAFEAAKTNGYEIRDVIGILGEPNKISENGTVLEYSLLPGSESCKGIVKLEDNIVVEYSVDNCK
jgi:hypothetical protein